MNQTDVRLEAVRDYVISIFSNSTQKKYLEHTFRVCNYAETIGLEEQCDMRLLRPAALLHDIGMTVDASFVGHVQKSKLLAGGMLQTVGYHHEEVNSIVKIVGSHHPAPGAPLDSIEEMVLFDADNMDVVGPVGMLRWIGTFSLADDLERSVDLYLSILQQCVTARGSLFYSSAGRRHGDHLAAASRDYFAALKGQLQTLRDNPSAFPPLPPGYAR